MRKVFLRDLSILNNFPSTRGVLWRLICSKLFSAGDLPPDPARRAYDAPRDPKSAAEGASPPCSRHPRPPHCRKKVRLSPKTARQRRNSATVALFCDSVHGQAYRPLDLGALGASLLTPPPSIKIPGYATTRYAPTAKKFRLRHCDWRWSMIDTDLITNVKDRQQHAWKN